ncbi:unnamed protein product [Camellia sinensis]
MLGSMGVDLVNVCDGIRCEMLLDVNYGLSSRLVHVKCSQGTTIDALKVGSRRLFSSTKKEKMRLFLALKSLFM